MRHCLSPARRAARGTLALRLGQSPIGTPVLVFGLMLLACAAGGKGGPPPLHSRPGPLPLGTPI